ncbi:PTS system mannose/fructose/sorbose family transporter subunit IID [Clostridium sp. CTA-7]
MTKNNENQLVKNNEVQVGKHLTEKDLKNVNFRWLYGSQIGWNYERMMGLGYIYAILPALEKIYKDDKEALKESLRTHSQFFNTEPDMGHLIVGASLAVEEEKGIEGKEAVLSIKNGLMGPFAGVGDTIFGVIAGTVFGAIAANMAIKGSYTGLVIWTVFLICRWFIRTKMFSLGYKQGTLLVTKFKDKLNYFTEAATILGLTVIGALIPSVVRVTIPYEFVAGDVVMKVQDVLNQIMPGLAHVGLAALCFWLLGRKKITSTKLIVFVMILSVVLFNLGILV